MNNYYGSAVVAREAARLWLFAVGGKTTSPGKGFDPITGYYYFAKNADGDMMRWYFTGSFDPGAVRR